MDNNAILADYLKENQIRKLHIGCGGHLLDGWLNCDVASNSDRVFKLDAGKPLPFEDKSFDFVYSEHLIEHLEFAEGYTLLTECHRVMKSGSRIRVATPNFDFLISLYQQPQELLHMNYMLHASENFLKSKPPIHDPMVIINNFVRAWGHQFIYSKSLLAKTMQNAGFRSIAECSTGQSMFSALRDLEHTARLTKSFYDLETMILEATKF